MKVASGRDLHVRACDAATRQGARRDSPRPADHAGERRDCRRDTASGDADAGRRRYLDGRFAKSSVDAAVPPQLASAQIAAIKSSHCGLVDTNLARGMAAAQIARDQFIAQSIEAFAERGVVVLAGNGHVRRDIGAPRWLSPSTREHTISIGLLEDDDRIADAFDHVFVTPRQPREDPCLAMRKPMRPPN